MSRRGRTGVSMGGGVERSDASLARVRRERAEERKRWAAKSGPVERSYLPCPDCGKPHDRREACP